MSAITAATVDAGYGVVTADNLAIIRAAETEIRSRQRRVYDDAVAIGRELVRVKGILEHGKFEAWIAATFSFSASSALNFMRLSENLGGKTVTVADLPLGILYRAAAAAVTDEERQQLFAPTEAGSAPTEPVIKDRLADLRAAKKQREREEQEAAKDTPERRAREKRQRERQRTLREDQNRRARAFEDNKRERTRDVARFLVAKLSPADLNQFLSLWGREISPYEVPSAIAVVREGRDE